MINIKKLKSEIGVNDVIKICTSLDIHCKSQNDKELIFQSVCCHGVKTNKYKLYYYVDSQKFHCYICTEQYDIFSLIQHIKQCNFVTALTFVCDTLGIDSGIYERYGTKQTFNWKAGLSKYLKNNFAHCNELNFYNDSILEMFDNVYWQDWINFGLSIDTLQHFEIGWCDRLQAVTIPCRDDNGNLVGVRIRNTNPNIEPKYIPFTDLQNITYSFPSNLFMYGEYQNKPFIEKSQKVWLVESEKSVLKAGEWFGLNSNPTLALLGSNLSKYNKQYILDLHPKEITIFADRDYKKGDKIGFERWKTKQLKIANSLKNYTQVYIATDREFLLPDKSNLFDGDFNYFKEQYERRIKIK